MLASLLIPSLLDAQIAGSVRDVQIRSIDFENQTIELHNFGDSEISIDGWRFCTHDETDGFDYTGVNGFSGESLDSGESIFIDWDDPNPTAANTIGVDSLGGAWIDDLLVAQDGEAVQIGIYTQGPFGTADNLVDHVQFSFNGLDTGSPADSRGGTAENAGLWNDRDEWIAIEADSTGILLTADPFPGDTVSHGVDSYSVITAVPEPTSIMILSLGLIGLASTRRRNQ